MIARHGVPVAELGPIRSHTAERRLGELRGRVRVPEDFNALLPEDVLADFER